MYLRARVYVCIISRIVRMYVVENIRFQYLFIVDARRVAYVAEVVPDVEDAARAELLVAKSRNSGRRGRCARVTG
jgi:hypothetical protein